MKTLETSTNFEQTANSTEQGSYDEVVDLGQFALIALKNNTGSEDTVLGHLLQRVEDDRANPNMPTADFQSSLSR